MKPADLPSPDAAAPPTPPADSSSPSDEIPADSAFAIELRPLSFADPFRWLAAGWQDFRRAPLIGLFFGACFMLMGWCLLGVYEHAPIYTLALSASFLLMGPFLCLGLYQVSRRLQQGFQPRLLDCLTAWRKRMSQIAIFGTVLLILEMIWGRAALVVFAVSFDGMPDLAGSLGKLLNPENLGFITAYLGIGGFFAGLIYSVSVVSIPMLLDRPTDAVTAGLTSLRLVLTQTGVMLFWGALITVLVVLALLPGFAGLLVVGPVLGHASWHAYRAAVVE
ncbi:DUF2189 domain-containing protein [Paucibacter sp. DJ2R-2]|uniref:DUF2189 domain-containing protein n=1 Tax=Paucibacter sp. DJ2R-2 TaxID=2893558 RepID=UPI0021E50F5F|nr:DUF2189 domain-containing protein [Paucibacter sp. DJ2R-2]MCV2420734.1 DUF2189 domain-containing protein [Paucibacter sp. DJ4R-1]MCV2439933.1 DUF2189 domain-containing protein [Paucibacter sp. DJ2R-2]